MENKKIWLRVVFLTIFVIASFLDCGFKFKNFNSFFLVRATESKKKNYKYEEYNELEQKLNSIVNSINNDKIKRKIGVFLKEILELTNLWKDTNISNSNFYKQLFNSVKVFIKDTVLYYFFNKYDNKKNCSLTEFIQKRKIDEILKAVFWYLVELKSYSNNSENSIKNYSKETLEEVFNDVKEIFSKKELSNEDLKFLPFLNIFGEMIEEKIKIYEKNSSLKELLLDFLNVIDNEKYKKNLVYVKDFFKLKVVELIECIIENLSNFPSNYKNGSLEKRFEDEEKIYIKLIDFLYSFKQNLTEFIKYENDYEKPFSERLKFFNEKIYYFIFEKIDDLFKEEGIYLLEKFKICKKVLDVILNLFKIKDLLIKEGFFVEKEKGISQQFLIYNFSFGNFLNSNLKITKEEKKEKINEKTIEDIEYMDLLKAVREDSKYFKKKGNKLYFVLLKQAIKFKKEEVNEHLRDSEALFKESYQNVEVFEMYKLNYFNYKIKSEIKYSIFNIIENLNNSKLDFLIGDEKQFIEKVKKLLNGFKKDLEDGYDTENILNLLSNYKKSFYEVFKNLIQLFEIKYFKLLMDLKIYELLHNIFICLVEMEQFSKCLIYFENKPNTYDLFEYEFSNIDLDLAFLNDSLEEMRTKFTAQQKNEEKEEYEALKCYYFFVDSFYNACEKFNSMMSSKDINSNKENLKLADLLNNKIIYAKGILLQYGRQCLEHYIMKTNCYFLGKNLESTKIEEMHEKIKSFLIGKIDEILNTKDSNLDLDYELFETIWNLLKIEQYYTLYYKNFNYKNDFERIDDLFIKILTGDYFSQSYENIMNLIENLSCFKNNCSYKKYLFFVALKRAVYFNYVFFIKNSNHYNINKLEETRDGYLTDLCKKANKLKDEIGENKLNDFLKERQCFGFYFIPETMKNITDFLENFKLNNKFKQQENFLNIFEEVVLKFVGDIKSKNLEFFNGNKDVVEICEIYENMIEEFMAKIKEKKLFEDIYFHFYYDYSVEQILEYFVYFFIKIRITLEAAKFGEISKSESSAEFDLRYFEKAFFYVLDFLKECYNKDLKVWSTIVDVLEKVVFIYENTASFSYYFNDFNYNKQLEYFNSFKNVKKNIFDEIFKLKVEKKDYYFIRYFLKECRLPFIANYWCELENKPTKFKEYVKKYLDEVYEYLKKEKEAGNFRLEYKNKIENTITNLIKLEQIVLTFLDNFENTPMEFLSVNKSFKIGDLHFFEAFKKVKDYFCESKIFEGELKPIIVKVFNEILQNNKTKVSEQSLNELQDQFNSIKSNHAKDLEPESKNKEKFTSLAGEKQNLNSAVTETKQNIKILNNEDNKENKNNTKNFNENKNKTVLSDALNLTNNENNKENKNNTKKINENKNKTVLSDALNLTNNEDNKENKNNTKNFNENKNYVKVTKKELNEKVLENNVKQSTKAIKKNFTVFSKPIVKNSSNSQSLVTIPLRVRNKNRVFLKTKNVVNEKNKKTVYFRGRRLKPKLNLKKITKKNRKSFKKRKKIKKFKKNRRLKRVLRKLMKLKKKFKKTN